MRISQYETGRILAGCMTAVLVAATGSVRPLRQVPATAQRFVSYYTAIQRSDWSLPARIRAAPESVSLQNLSRL